MIDRRTFFRVSGAAALTAAWQGAAGCTPSPRAANSGGPGAASGSAAGAGGTVDFPIASIGVQLYTVRGVMQQDVDAALRQVAEAGYRLVETAGTGGKSTAEFRALLDRHGLSSPAGHWPLEALQGDFDGTIAAAKALGQRYVVVPWINESLRGSLDDWRRIADQLNALGQRVQAAGLQLGYHNHDFEFQTYGGQAPAYDVLLQATDPKLVALEADLYWMYKAGADPVAYFDRFPGRFRLVHVKDGTAAPEKRMVDVGQGVIDWRRIFAAADRAGIQYGFVEHDQPDDAIRSIRASHAYLAGVLRHA